MLYGRIYASDAHSMPYSLSVVLPLFTKGNALSLENENVHAALG